MAAFVFALLLALFGSSIAAKLLLPFAAAFPYYLVSNWPLILSGRFELSLSGSQWVMTLVFTFLPALVGLLIGLVGKKLKSSILSGKLRVNR